MYENLALSETGFLFDARTGLTYNLNRTGAFILRKLIDGTSPPDVCALLVERFDVDQDIAARDVDQFVFRLRELSLAQKAETDR